MRIRASCHVRRPRATSRPIEHRAAGGDEPHDSRRSPVLKEQRSSAGTSTPPATTSTTPLRAAALPWRTGGRTRSLAECDRDLALLTIPYHRQRNIFASLFV